MEAKQVLMRYFGYAAFKEGQESMIRAVLDKKDALGIMPTGAGKSICYQVPAVMLPGITLVISPLISLMRDQVAALNQTGIRAAFINSTLSYNQMKKALYYASMNVYKIIYVAPERLLTTEFLDFAIHAHISMVAVDEAHCVSQWGQDFRPSYLKIKEFCEALPIRPVVCAFTATATDRVREDIKRLLALQNPYCIVTGFDRENLSFSVMSPSDKMTALIKVLEERPKCNAIIYCATRKNVETVHEDLIKMGFSAARYHAGLSEEERATSQDDFIYDRCRILVATNAFGMGIDKSNVSLVLHYNMPKDPESYYQEAGRAGRDGSPAECILFYAPKDVETARFLIEKSNSESEDENKEQKLKNDLNRLETMRKYAIQDGCLRHFLLAYFGEKSPEVCNNCSNCLSDFEQVDYTREARLMLDGIEKFDGVYGAGMLIDILYGAGTKRIRERFLDESESFGILSMCPKPVLEHLLNQLLVKGYVYKTAEQYPVICLGDKSLKASDRFYIRKKTVPKTQPKTKKTEVFHVEDNGLYERLRELRMKLAREKGVPAYVIFSDATLREMSMKKPRNQEEFMQIAGVGESKRQQYGEIFLKEINRY